MSGGKPVGTMFAEVDLDLTKVEQKMVALHKRLVDGASKSEEAFKTLGVASDRMFASQKAVADTAYNAIKNKAESTAADIVRSQSAMVAKINSLNAQMAKNHLYETLGVRSVAAIEAQKAAVISAYDTIKKSGTATSQDLINIERAKNTKLKELNDEMVGNHKKAFGEQESAMAGLTRTILRWYAAYYVASTGLSAIVSGINKATEAIDEYNNAITTMAALITSRMKMNDGETLAEGYQRARVYATGLVQALEQIDKHTSMNLTELTEMSQEMVRQGVILDTNNQEAVKGFTNVANALSAMIGNAPDRMRQISQETRALLTGQTRESDKLAKSVASMTPDFEKQLEIHKQMGDQWQWLGQLLIGFTAAQSDIDKSLLTTKSTLQTIWQQILRDGFGSAYKDITDYLRQIAQWALDHKEQIASLISDGWNKLKEVVSEVNRYLTDLHVYDLLGSMFSILGQIVKVMWEYRDAVVAVSIAYAAFKITAWIAGFQALTTATSAVSAAMTAAGGIAGISGLVTTAGAAITGLIASLGALINPITLVGLAIAGVVGIVTYGYLEHSKATQELERYKDSLSTMSTKELSDQLKALTDLENQIKNTDHAIGGFVQTLPQVAERWKMVTDEILRRQPETLNFLSQMAAYFNSMANVKMPTLGSRVELPKSSAYKAPSFVEDVLSPGAIAKKMAIEQSAAMLSVANASSKVPELKSIATNKSSSGKSSANQYANTLRSITDEVTKWQNKINEMNPALDKQDSEILKLTDDANELIKRIQDQGEKAKVDTTAFVASIKQSLGIGKEYIEEKQRLKAHEDYLKMVSEEADFASTENERAINKIISQEEKKIYDLVDIWATGAISDEEFVNTEVEIRNNAALARVEIATEEAKRISDINSNLIRDIKGLEDWAYELRLKQIDAEAEKYKKDGAAVQAVEAWKEYQQQLAIIQKSIAGTDMFAGFTAQADQYLLDMETAGQQGAELFENTMQDMNSSFSDIFYDGMVGKLNSLSDYFSSFCTSMARNFANTLSKMATNWAMFGSISGEVTDSASSGGILGILKNASSLVSKIPYVGKAYDWLTGTLGIGSSTLGGVSSLAAMFPTASIMSGTLGSTAGFSLLGSGGASAALATGGASIGSSGIMSSLTSLMTNPLTIGIGAALGGLYMSGALKNVLGKTNVRSTNGMQVDQTTIEQLVRFAETGENVQWRNYQDIHTSKYSVTGGSSRRNSHYVTDVADDVETAFSDTMEAIGVNIVAIGETIGSDMSEIMAYRWAETKIDLKDLSETDAQAKIQQYFTDMADQAVSDLFGDFFAQFQQESEGMYDAAVRVITEMATVTAALGTMNQSLNSTGKEAIVVSQNIIEFAGGLETLQGYFTTYYEKFFSEQERATDLYEALSGTLAEQNMVVPETRKAYRALVESLDLSGESGQKAFATLMALAEQADTYYSYLEDQLLSTAEDDFTSAVNAQKEALTAQYNAELDALNTRLDAAKGVVSDLTAMVDKLTQAKESMRLEDEKYLKGMYEFSMRRLFAIVEEAKGGDLSGVKNIDTILSYLTSKDNTKYYSTALEYQRDYWKIYYGIGELESLTGDQLTEAEQTVALLEDEIDVLKEWYDDEVKALEEMHDSILGLDKSVLSLPQSIANLIAAQIAAGSVSDSVASTVVSGLYQSVLGRAADTGGATYYTGQLQSGTSVSDIVSSMVSSSEYAAKTDTVESLYQSILGRSSDTAGKTYWTAQYNAGMSTAEIASRMMDSSEYASIKSTRGYAEGGISSGPESGYEATLHGTELIVSPKKGYPASVSNTGNADLILEIRELREDQEMQAVSIASTLSSIDKRLKMLEKWESIGMPATRAA